MARRRPGDPFDPPWRSPGQTHHPDESAYVVMEPVKGGTWRLWAGPTSYPRAQALLKLAPRGSMQFSIGDWADWVHGKITLAPSWAPGRRRRRATPASHAAKLRRARGLR